MSDWVVIPCLKALQEEFDHEAPHRDKGAEGFKADTNHASDSDHQADEDSNALRNKDSDNVNEVHAYDCDSSGPWPDGKRGDIKGSWFDKKIHALVDRERERWRDPNDKCRLNYVIWFDQIADKDNDFQWVPYTGTPDPHTNHAHFSARYETSCEKDTSSWGVAEQEDDLVTTQAEFDNFMTNSWKNPTVVNSFLDNVKITDYADKPPAGKPQRVLTLRQWIGYAESRAQVNVGIEETKTVGEQVAALDEKIEAHISGLIEGQ